ncbi:MAG: M16 family metallopeptidase, partial [Novosphingobium sp.]
MKSRLLAAAALLILPLAAPLHAKEAAPAAAPAVKAPKIEYTQWQLKNGLTVIAIPDPATANVLVSMWYGVGGKHDPEGRSGFAHLFEHILSRKTVNMPYNMINRLTEDVGGVRNASFPEEEFQRERKRALDGLKVALKDPGSLGGLALQPLVYGAAPY